MKSFWIIAQFSCKIQINIFYGENNLFIIFRTYAVEVQNQAQ